MSDKTLNLKAEYKTENGSVAVISYKDEFTGLYKGVLYGNTKIILNAAWKKDGTFHDEVYGTVNKGLNIVDFNPEKALPVELEVDVVRCHFPIELTGLNIYCLEFHKEMVEKGFWDHYFKALDLSLYGAYTELSSAIRDAFISQKIALIQSELGEALEAMRHNKYGLEEKDTFEDEIADSLFRIFDLCGMLGIDIEKQLRWKRNHNKSREKMHGKGF